MNPLVRVSSAIWIIALVGAGGFLLWINTAQIQRAQYVSGLGDPPTVTDLTSATGYASGLRRLIVPEHNNESYQWLAQTQQMFARHEARIRHVDYDNAPSGREVRTPSVYRWWLGLVAWCDHLISRRSIGQGVENAALFADPALQFILLIGAVLFTVRHFGTLPATLLAVGWVALFPFAGAFLSGQPGDRSLAQACAFWSVSPLLAAIGARDERETSVAGKRWLPLMAGVAGGVGLWVHTSTELPILAGIVVGGFLAIMIGDESPTAPAESIHAAPWRVWALGGAATTLIAYLVEYYPAHMDYARLETIHPLFGLAWIGGGELLQSAAAWRRKIKSRPTVRPFITIGLASLFIAAVPVAIHFMGSSPFSIDDAFAWRLSNLADGPVAQDLWSWLIRDGLKPTAMATATFLPLLLLGPAIWLLARRSTRSDQRAGIALTLGPVAVCLALGYFQLGWWSFVGAMLLTVLIASTTNGLMTKVRGWAWLILALVVIAPGAILLSGQARAEKHEALTETEAIALIERDLAYWLSNQAGPGAVVLAPPNLTTSLYFHGGLSGIGTPYWENKDGFNAAVRIAGATLTDESLAIAQAHHLTYIILPSWDPFMDEYARLGSRASDHSLIALLHQWLPPRWLRPVPYHLPKIAGFERLSVVIFQVTDVQDNPTALGQLAEYFLEMDQPDQAVQVSQALARLFPNELAAWVARTLVDQAQGNAAGFTEGINQLTSFIARGEEEALPWNRRVGLAIALAEGKRFDLAKEQTKQCLTLMDEAGVRSLTTLSLYRLQVLAKAFELEITDSNLRKLCRDLLPAEMREKL